jgi:hypothetical protein
MDAGTKIAIIANLLFVAALLITIALFVAK